MVLALVLVISEARGASSERSLGRLAVAGQTNDTLTFDFSTVFTRAAGSDKWPLTWASDGNLYGAWGDGNGWQLGPTYYPVGVTRIAGIPPRLTGTDVWVYNGIDIKPAALVAERARTIHMFFTKQSENGQAAYYAVSSDNGVTWSDPATAPLVFSTADDGVFVGGIAQFGPGYTNLPPRVDPTYFYVYLVAGNPRGVELARVPRSNISNRSAYSFFAGLDAAGNPIWTVTISDAVAVVNTGPEEKVGVSYNYGTHRFYLAQGENTSWLRVMDSATLWGPWRQLYYGEFRDKYWKFCYMLPPKWMSADGHTMWLAWSGWPEYDGVSFIKAHLSTASACGPRTKTC